MARRATAQDVADLAGVSRSSVSLVLNGRADGNISAVKQVAIIDAARQLSYRPNTLALSLRNRRTHTIGVLTWPGNQGSPGGMLHAAWVSAAAAGYLLLLMDAGEDREHEERAVTTLLDRQVDGFIVVAPELVEYRPLEVMAGTPTVLLNCVDPDRAVTSIAPDEFEAAASATRILIELGHDRVALLSDDAGTAEVRERVAGVHAELASAGLPAPVVLRARREIQSGASQTRQALLSAEPPTGLVCTHERLALGAVLAAAELGVAIPTDLSVVSLEDGEGLAAALVPPMTTVQRPDRGMADEAVQMLVRELEGVSGPDVRQLLFVCPPRRRASTGPVPVSAPAGRP